MQHYSLLINSSHLLEYDHQITGEKPDEEEKEWGPVEFAESLEWFRQSDAPFVTSSRYLHIFFILSYERI